MALNNFYAGKLKYTMIPRTSMTKVFFNIEQGEFRYKGIVFLDLYMKTLSCRDAGCDCDYIAKGETEEEVIRDAAQHGMKEHGKTQEDMTQMQRNLRAAIRSS